MRGLSLTAAVSLCVLGLGGLASAQVTVAPGSTHGIPYPVVRPYQPGHCPAPATPPSPTVPPSTPPSTPTPTEPQAPGTAPAELGTGAGEAGGGGLASGAPNMFGDYFGSRGVSITVTRPPIIIPGMPGSTGRVIDTMVPVSPRGNPSRLARFVASSPDTFSSMEADGPGYTGLTTRITELWRRATRSPVTVPLNSPILRQASLFSNWDRRNQTVFPLFPNAQAQADVETFLARTTRNLRLGGRMVFLADPAFSGAVRLTDVVVTRGGGDGTEVSVTNTPTSGLLYTYRYTEPDTTGTPDRIILIDPLIVTVPSPTGGGAVGRTKVADDNNPLPRDRFIFNYDYFNSARLFAGGVDVHRFSPGLEMAFFDQLASIEVRLPFAATLNSDIVADSGVTANRAELGNLHITLKALVYGSETLNVATGLGFALPTADDVTVSLMDGMTLMRIKNDSLLVEPYVALLYTPNERLFMQTWLQFAFTTNSNRVEADVAGAGLQKIGGLYDNSLALLSGQIGYWAYRSTNPEAWLTGVAPFAELHYNASLGGANTVAAGFFQAGDRRSIQELNLTAGLTLLLRQNFQLMVGASAPILQGDNQRTFDYQIGIRGNLFFGATAASRSPATLPSSF